MDKAVKVATMYLVVAVVFVCGLELGAKAVQEKIGKYEVGQQFVMVVNSTKPDGGKVVVLKEVVPVLELVDGDDQHSAPLPDGTNMLCREIYEYLNQAHEPRLAFYCGNDILVARNIAFVSKKDVKNIKGMEEK